MKKTQTKMAAESAESASAVPASTSGSASAGSWLCSWLCCTIDEDGDSRLSSTEAAVHRADGYVALRAASPAPATPAGLALRRESEFRRRFSVQGLLGRGSTASCFACVERASGRAFAVKVMDLRKISVLFSDLIPQFRKEVDILRRVPEHAHIIRLHDVFESPTKLHVVTELAHGGELFDYLVDHPSSALTEATVSLFVRQMASAVAHLHAHGVIHRDLKLENILLAERCERYQDIRLKIIDFGLAKSFTPMERKAVRKASTTASAESAQKRTVTVTVPATGQTDADADAAADAGADADAEKNADADADADASLRSPLSARTFFGTVGYIAPEMMRRRRYTRGIDVWALGVVTFVLLCGVFPFDAKRKRSHDYRLRFPAWVQSELSDSAKDLLQKLLCVDPAKRVTSKQALAHPWVAGETASPRAVLGSPKHFHGLQAERQELAAQLPGPANTVGIGIDIGSVAAMALEPRASALAVASAEAKSGRVSPLLLDQDV